MVSLVSMNRAGARLLEVDDEMGFIRRPWVEVWSHSADLASAALDDAVKADEGRFQGFCATARGTPKWWDVLVTPIRDDRGTVTRLLSIWRDITEQKRADEERNQLLERERQARSDAEHAMQMKDEFLATLSHELRTPLNSIVGWIGVLKQDQSRETLRKAIDVIDRNSRRQAQMIDDLLDVSRIVSGKLPLAVHAVNLVSVIDEVVVSARAAADAKGVHLTTAYDSNPDVSGDRPRLQQVVWNLVSNAIKFTSRDGIVQWRCTSLTSTQRSKSLTMARGSRRSCCRTSSSGSCRGIPRPRAGTEAWDWVWRSSRTSLRCMADR